MRGARLPGEIEVEERIDCERGDRVARALRVDLEVTDRLDRVAEELDAHWLLEVRREEVDDPAAEGEVADLADEVGPRVAVLHEALDECARVDLHARLEPDHTRRERVGRGNAVVERAGRNDEDVDFACEEAREGANLIALYGE